MFSLPLPFAPQGSVNPYVSQGSNSQFVPQGIGSSSSIPSHDFQAMSAQHSQEFTNRNSWIIDTGASHHMSHDVTHLNRATPYEGTEKIIVGNGKGQGNKDNSSSRKE
ncbi:uncharacterized protein LOC126603501 isoform X2 [Malus sylvestris]|uniref:uncharacterized protein LOC126603501 isoform X2 n=1 Tax=Malus sylvestris TaxID=3752 RepID=UPI0021ABAECF|nr:uncharacterized protein LOC126603501 isoform X2 [Malus sylvestris]